MRGKRACEPRESKQNTGTHCKTNGCFHCDPFVSTDQRLQQSPSGFTKRYVHASARALPRARNVSACGGDSTTVFMGDATRRAPYAEAGGIGLTAAAGPSSPRLRSVETDAALIDRLRDGDEAAFVTLVDRYHEPMVRLARSMVSSQAVAEEAVQDAWLGVVRGIERFEGRSSIKTWLFRILVNRARSAGAREERNAPLDAEHAVDPARFDAGGQWAEPVERWRQEFDDRLESAVWAPILRSALEQLPARQRTVVVLRDVEGLSSDEVCSVLGISGGNQRILLHRGRSRMREMLDSEMRKD
jgi:RNA polymerase sigma-70 factor, ECF subfamily